MLFHKLYNSKKVLYNTNDGDILWLYHKKYNTWCTMLYNTKKCYITTSFSIPSFSTASTQGTPWGPCGSQRLGSWGSTLVPPAQVSLRPNRPLWLWPRWHWPSMAWAFARIFVPPDRAQGAAGPKLGRRRRDAAWTVAVIIVLSLAGWQLQAKARSAYDVFTHYRSVQSRWPPGRSQWPQPTARERHGGRVAWVKQQSERPLSEPSAS